MTTTPTKNESLPEPMTASMRPSPDYAKGWNDCLTALTREAPTEGDRLSAHSMDLICTGVAKRFTLDTEPSRRACLRNAVEAAINLALSMAATPPAPQRQSSNPSGLSSESAPLSSEQRLAQGEDSINVPAAKALIAAVGPGYRVIYRSAFRWMDDKGNVLPNHYEMFGASSLAKDFGYDLVLDLGFAAIIRDALPPDALTHDEQSIEDDLRAYGVGFTMNGVRVDPSQVVVHQPPHHDRGEVEQWARELLERFPVKVSSANGYDAAWAAGFNDAVDLCREDALRAITAALTEAKQQGPGEGMLLVKRTDAECLVRDAERFIGENQGTAGGRLARKRVRALLTAPQVEAKPCRVCGEQVDSWVDQPAPTCLDCHAGQVEAKRQTGEGSLRVIAKRNLQRLIEIGSTDKATMLSCLEELS